jgi:hypothetical protein
VALFSEFDFMHLGLGNFTECDKYYDGELLRNADLKYVFKAKKNELLELA